MRKKTGQSPADALERRVLAFIQRSRLEIDNTRLVVAVSGGPDSVCLLHVLLSLRAELGFSLHVAHLNHGLRGAEADGDAEYVAGMVQRWGLPATIERRDVAAYRVQKHLTLEEAAREVRYAFLAEVARQTGAGAVAVGHTRDDNVETILMHLVRGSGLRGLRGLRPASCLNTSAGKVTLVRPLLQVSREETIEYCRRHGLAPRLDSSNLSLTLLRNRVRHQLLPVLASYNPRIREALLRTAGIVADDFAFLESELDRVWDSVVSVGPSSIALDKAGLLKLPVALQRQALRRAIEAFSGSIEDYEAVHIEDMIEALHKPAGKRIDLPQGLVFAVEYHRYILTGDTRTLCSLPDLEGENIINVPGQAEIGGWLIRADIVDVFPDRAADPNQAYLDRDRIGERLVVRRRQTGDSFQPLGMKAEVTVKDFMINARIPRACRQRVPVFVSNGQIVWLGGWRIDERCKVTGETRRVLHLAMEPTHRD